MPHYALKPAYSLDPHQHTAAEFAKSRPRGGAALWLETGLGKGMVGIYMILDWLNAGITRILVTCPAGLVQDWVYKLDMYAGIRAEVWDAEQECRCPVQIISHSLLQEPKASSKVKRRNRVAEIVKWFPQAVIVDEAHKMKSYGASQTKGLMKIAKLGKPSKRLALTATPTTTIDPEELRPQLLFVDSALMEKYSVADWKGFRKRFCKLETMYMGGMTVDKVIGVKNQNVLDEITAQVAIKQDGSVLNLPDGVFSPTFYSMSPRAARLYAMMAKEGSILEKDMEVVTTNALDRALRCFELRSGFVKDFEGKFHSIDDTVISLTTEMTRNTPLPLLIVYRFRYTGDRLEEALNKEGLRVGHIRGGVSAIQKSGIEQKFQAGGYDVVLGQFAAVSPPSVKVI